MSLHQPHTKALSVAQKGLSVPELGKPEMPFPANMEFLPPEPEGALEEQSEFTAQTPGSTVAVERGCSWTCELGQVLLTPLQPEAQSLGENSLSTNPKGIAGNQPGLTILASPSCCRHHPGLLHIPALWAS